MDHHIIEERFLPAFTLPKSTIFQDSLLSAQFRRPDREQGDVSPEEAAVTNAFAA
ncbi:MAG: hypothetical protein HQ498_11120 [Pseudohongiella sp.]|nr:hypothetical protein [Pseudohongiella sp.]